MTEHEAVDAELQPDADQDSISSGIADEFTPAQITAAARLAGRIAAHQSWANTVDRPARTANARAAMQNKFLQMADGDPIRAEHFRKAHYQRMALKSAASRRANSKSRGTAA